MGLKSEHYDAIARELLVETASSRTTVRLVAEDGTIELVAEALADGVESMRDGPTTRDIAAAETYLYLERERDLLIQDDCRSGHPAPPESLISLFHVYAQMLAPIVVGGRMVGTISVHQKGTARAWSEADVTVLARARQRIEHALGAGG